MPHRRVSPRQLLFSLQKLKTRGMARIERLLAAQGRKGLRKYNSPLLSEEPTMKTGVFSALLILMFLTLSARATETRATIIYDDRAADIASAREETGQLWITTADLKRATRFEVKPQGVCRDELCFPLPKAKQQDFLHKERGTTWFNMTGFAALVRQPVAHDVALA